jgi:methylated-DNA-[protein]-cysteine S-methyltransferase
MELVFKWIDSPVGPLKLVGSDTGLAAVLWENDDPRRVRLGYQVEDNQHALLLEVERQLGDYFKQERRTFELPLAFAGTSFQEKVWRALLTIPYGQTSSYSEIAHQIGHPSAMRAVGAANGRNPLSIVAPCHRVIGASGALTGFAGGLEVKRYLLDLEANTTICAPRRAASRVGGVRRPASHTVDPLDPLAPVQRRPVSKTVQV